MIAQTIFRPSAVTGADGWTETGAPLVGAAQPPNRTLPAPIFDDGTSYSTHNGNTGNWVIRKLVWSDVAGPGFLSLPAGTYPTAGGLYADDAVAAIRVNGGAVTFAGLGSGVLPEQSVPVTWVAGNNTVDIEVSNTVAGATSLAGTMRALGPGVPCDCCDTGGPRCALVPVPFTGVAETASQAGWVPQTLDQTIDGNTGGQVPGYNSPSGTAASTTVQVTYTNSAPQNRVRGLRLWNQGGSILTDFDGLGQFTADFFSGASLLYSLVCNGANGGAAQTFTLPGGLALDGVTTIVLHDLGKLSGSTVAPLWRELQQVVLQTVFPCRRTSGALEWYDQDGNRVNNGDVIDCASTGPTPLIVTDLTMNASAFDQASGTVPGLNETATISPYPAASVSTGTVLVAPNHYQSSAASPNTAVCGGKFLSLTYTPSSSFEFTYEGFPAGSTVGGVYLQFVAPSLGGALSFGLWASGTFLPGQSKSINVPGGIATLTYLEGPTNASAPRGVAPTCFIGAAGTNILGLHFSGVNAVEYPIKLGLTFTAV